MFSKIMIWHREYPLIIYHSRVVFTLGVLTGFPLKNFSQKHKNAVFLLVSLVQMVASLVQMVSYIYGLGVRNIVLGV